MPRWATTHNPLDRQAAARRAGLLALAVVVLGVVLPASATVYNNRNPNNPDNVNDPWKKDIANEVGVIEKLNSPVPLDLVFYDEAGAPVELAELFKPGRPVIFNLGYSRCPSICVQMRSQLADTLPESELKLGEDVVILNVSIDPNETPEQSAAMRDQVLTQLKEAGVEPGDGGWRFFTAEQNVLDKLTAAVGYKYLYIPPQDEYGHPGVLVLADGEGVIRRYLSGTAYSPRTLRLSVVETSQGKVGSLLDRAFVTCFVWDPEANNYAATAKFIMMTGGVVVIIFVGGLFLFGMAYEKRRRKMLDEGRPVEDIQRPITLLFGGFTRRTKATAN